MRLGESSPLESQLRDELKTLQTRLEEETTLRVQQAAVFEQQTVELTAANAEKAVSLLARSLFLRVDGHRTDFSTQTQGIQKRAATMFEDNASPAGVFAPGSLLLTAAFPFPETHFPGEQEALGDHR